MQTVASETPPKFAGHETFTLRYGWLKKAFCGFHALLNRVATGVDAAHVHWHSLHGPDDVENGIALCKLHHWAFDKGILGIDAEERICIARVF